MYLKKSRTLFQFSYLDNTSLPLYKGTLSTILVHKKPTVEISKNNIKEKYFIKKYDKLKPFLYVRINTIFSV
jgi:hypothetical protein